MSFTLQSCYLGVLSASLDTFPPLNVNGPAVCLVCLCVDAIVLPLYTAAECKQDPSKRRRQQVWLRSPQQSPSLGSPVKPAITNIFILTVDQINESLLVVTNQQRIMTWVWSSPHLYRAFRCISAHCVDFLAGNVTILAHSHSSHQHHLGGCKNLMYTTCSASNSKHS